MATWLEEANLAAPIYKKGAVNDLFRNRPILRMLADKRNIKLNEAAGNGTGHWKIKTGITQTKTSLGEGRREFERTAKYVDASMTFGGYYAAENMTDRDKEMLESGGGAGMIINHYKQVLPDCIKSVTEAVGSDIWNTDTTDPALMVGIPVACAFTTASLDANDRILRPSGTYAGVNIALQSQGGSWSSALASADRPNTALGTDWPMGQGDYEYDATSPLIVRIDSTGWGTGSTAWIDNCELILRYAKDWQINRSGMEGRADVCLMAQDLFTEFKTYYAAKERWMIPHPTSVRLGMPDTINFEGMMITTDYDIPAGEAYLMNMDYVVLATFRKELVYTEPITYVVADGRYLFYAGSDPQLRLNPRSICRIVRANV